MRPIKFRGYVSWEKKWYYGYYYVDSDGIHLIRSTTNKDKEFSIQVIPETVGQFTGCYDADGKEIYEGDMVKYHDLPCGVVKFGNKGNFGIKWIDVKNAGDWLRDMDKEFISECKIIGNIHDNPELVAKVLTSNPLRHA